MNVSLTPELEQYIADKVATGMYQTSSEVVREALRALREKELREAKLEELRREVEKGFADLEAGRMSTKTAADILKEVRERKAARSKSQ
jgi:antitoxin ParD1/3/4